MLRTVKIIVSQKFWECEMGIPKNNGKTTAFAVKATPKPIPVEIQASMKL